MIFPMLQKEEVEWVATQFSAQNVDMKMTRPQ